MTRDWPSLADEDRSPGHARGGWMIFSRDDALYRTDIAGNGFGPPTRLGEINGGDATTPVLANDGLTLYFGSSRSGGAGDTDIWRATRDTTADAFGELANVSELNLADFDFPEWLSDDGCRVGH